jgi:hypothetical protein
LDEGIQDENTGETNFDNDTLFDAEYTELVTPGTHEIADSENDNGCYEQKEDTKTRLGRVSIKFVRQNTCTIVFRKLQFVLCMVPSTTLLGLMS